MIFFYLQDLSSKYTLIYKYRIILPSFHNSKNIECSVSEKKEKINNLFLITSI